MRFPVHAGNLLNRVIKARGRLEGRLGRRPTVAELAVDLEVPEGRITDILRHAAGPLSLSGLWACGQPNWATWWKPGRGVPL